MSGLISSRQFCLFLLFYICLHGQFYSKNGFTTKLFVADISVSYIDDLGLSNVNRLKSEHALSSRELFMAGCCFAYKTATALLLVCLANDVSPNPGHTGSPLSTKDITTIVYNNCIV